MPFLLYSPLNQGLKLFCDSRIRVLSHMFLLYSPLNQGLKQFLSDDEKKDKERFYSTVH